MIHLRVNNDEFYDDALVLTKAFYPYEKIETNRSGEEEIYEPKADSTSDTVVEVNIDGLSANVSAYDVIDKEKIHLHRLSGISKDDTRKNLHDNFKQVMYKVLLEKTGKQLPWGMLTGVRPTKIVMEMLKEGKDENEIASYMKSHYFISDEKLALSLEVAKREKKIIEGIDVKNGYSLYIGVPFCPTTCLYCSFTSYPIGAWKKYTDAYVDALIKEIKAVASIYKGKKLDSVYFGGGTPTTLEPQQLDRVLTACYENFDMSTVRELTVEAGRPDSVTLEKFETLKKHNVTRISINPQTMNQKTLDLIGRRHTVEQVVESYKLARKCGFDDINMDLIVGLPGETIEDVRYTMEQIKELAPDNLTVHSLAIKRAAALKMKLDNYKNTITNTNEIINLTASYAREMGLNPYYLYRQKNMAGNFENVGYAKEGMEGIYNILIMEEVQTIVACGAGASTKIVYPKENRIERIENVKDVRNYIERIDEMIERKRGFCVGNN